MPDRQDRDHDFTEFVAARSASLVSTARQLCGDPDLAEDLVQSALEKVYPRWHRIEFADPYSYVRRAVVNQHMSRIRRRPWRELPVGDAAELDGHAATQVSGRKADPALGVERRMMLDAALARLTDREHSAVVLRYFQDRTEAQTAAALGVAIGTVKSTTSHALAKLRQAPEFIDR